MQPANVPSTTHNDAAKRKTKQDGLPAPERTVPTAATVSAGSNSATDSLHNTTLPNVTINVKPPVQESMPAVPSAPLTGEVTAVPQVAPKPIPRNTFVTNADLKTAVVDVAPSPVITTFPSPYTGLTSQFDTGPSPIVPPGRTVFIAGFRSPPPSIIVPDGWAVNLLEDPIQVIVPTHVTLMNLPSNARPLVNIDSAVAELLIQPALRAYPRGLSLATFHLNEALVNVGSAHVEGGVVIGDHFMSPFLIQKETQSIQTNVGTVISGAIIAATAMALRYRGILVYDVSKIQHTSGLSALDETSWLSTAWYPPQHPNVAMIKGFSGQTYVDNAIEHSNRFRYGRLEVIENLSTGITYRSRWATTYDNYTVELLGIAQRYIDNHTASFNDIRLLQLAHAPRGTVISQADLDPRAYRPVLMHDDNLMAAQLLYAIAKQPSLKVCIYELYTQYILDSCLLREEPMREFLESIRSITAASATKKAFDEKVGRGSMPDLIETLSFEIRPTFDYPSMETQPVSDYNQLLLCFLETTLFFVFFPKAAKYVAYELCNRLRSILRKLYVTEWGTYTRIAGYRYGLPGSDSPITKGEYLTGEHTPTMLHGPQHNTGWNVIRELSQLIQPIGNLAPRTLATDARLPIIDQEIFIPWDDPGLDVYGETQLAHRVEMICAFATTNLLPRIKKNMTQTSQILTGLSAVINAISSRRESVCRGLGMGVRRLFYSMINLSTNVVHGYDGSLATPVPYPIGLCDGTLKRSTPAMVQDQNSTYQLSTEVVWTLLFSTSFSFETVQFLNNQGQSLEVYANLPAPMTALTQHMNIYAYAEKVALAPGLVCMVFDQANANREPYVTMLELVRRSGSSPSYLSAGAYRKLLSMIGAIIDDKIVGHEGVTSYFNPKESGDMRYMQPIFRRITPLLTPSMSGPNDPAVLQGVPQLVDSMYRDMFEYGLNILLNPRSALSRLGTGFAIMLKTSEDVNFSDIFVDQGWYRMELTSANFVVVRQGGSAVRKLQIGDDYYDDPRTLPNRVFILNRPGIFSNDEIRFLIEGVKAARLVLLLPNAKYIYTVSTTDRLGYSQHVASLDLAELIHTASTSVAKLEFMSTVELQEGTMSLTVGHCDRYVFPLVAPKITVAFANMYGYTAHPTFQGPDPHLYETGHLNNDWRNTFDNGIPKSMAGISMSNEVIVRERRPGSYELPSFDYVMPDQLVSDELLL